MLLWLQIVAFIVSMTGSVMLLYRDSDADVSPQILSCFIALAANSAAAVFKVTTHTVDHDHNNNNNNYYYYIAFIIKLSIATCSACSYCALVTTAIQPRNSLQLMTENNMPVFATRRKNDVAKAVSRIYFRGSVCVCVWGGVLSCLLERVRT